MSTEALRKSVVEQFERLNVEAMTIACKVRPDINTSAEGLALVVVDQLAMARAYARCAAIVEDEFRKLTRPAQPAEVRKIREIY